MLRVLVHLVGHRARPSVAWQVAVVLATTGRTRRCPADSTNVGRPAFARPPRIRRLTQLTNLQRDAATLRGSDEETIACGAPADSEKRSTRHCAAQLPATNAIAENRRQLTRRCRAARSSNTPALPEATRKETQSGGYNWRLPERPLVQTKQ